MQKTDYQFDWILFDCEWVNYCVYMQILKTLYFKGLAGFFYTHCINTAIENSPKARKRMKMNKFGDLQSTN
jgi:hypothetical protein